MVSDIMEFLEVKIANQSFGIIIDKVVELSNACEVTEVPNSHPSVEGIYAWRDTTIAVLNLRNCLGKSCEYPVKGEFAVVQISGSDLALHVDSIMGISRVNQSNVYSSTPVSTSNCTVGVAKVEDRLVTLLDLDKLVSEITEGFEK